MFNYYFIVIPLMFIVATFAGYKFVNREKNGRKVVIHYASAAKKQSVALGLGLIGTILVVVESHAGLLQSIDNTIGADDPTGVWALLFWLLAVIVVFAGLSLAYYFVLRLAESRKIARYKDSAKANGFGYRVTNG